MQLPIFYHRGQKKPWTSIPRINWGHPLTAGLRCYTYDTGAGAYVDLVSGDIGTQQNAATQNAPSRAGKFGSGLLYTGLASAYNMGPVANFTAAQSAPYSYACGFMLNALGSVTASGVWLLANGSSVPMGFSHGFDGTNTINYNFSNGGAADIVIAAGTLTAQVYSCSVGVAATTTSNVAYYNGRQVGSNTSSNAVSFATCVPVINNLFSGAGTTFNGHTGFIYWGGLWKRGLRPSEAKMLYDDPYCFLIYPEDEMYAQLVGSAVTPPGDGPNFLTSLMPMMGVG